MRNSFKSMIRQIKAKEDKTQAELADILGIHKSYLSDMINERVPVTEAVLASIYEKYPYTKESAESSIPPLSSNIEEVKSYEVPLLPLDAIGGRLDGFAPNGVTISQCETITSPFKTATLAIRVKGQSMSPIYPSGCMLFIVKNNGGWLDWGKVYVLDTDNGVIVKQLSPSQKGENFICCKSFNNSPEYAPFDVPRTSIYGIYRVLGAMTEL